MNDAPQHDNDGAPPASTPEPASSDAVTAEVPAPGHPTALDGHREIIDRLMAQDNDHRNHASHSWVPRFARQLWRQQIKRFWQEHTGR